LNSLEAYKLLRFQQRRSKEQAQLWAMAGVKGISLLTALSPGI
jgi:hypothetical protein